MDPKVKEFVLRETSFTGVRLQEFDKLYYAFEQLLLYDIDTPKVEGVGQKLQRALNRIATESLTTEDIDDLIPDIWGQFEQFVKMLVYIIDKDKFNQIDNTYGFKRILEDFFGLRVTAPVRERTSEIEALHAAYELRNENAHESHIRSLAESYSSLAKSLAAYLIVTSKAIPKLQKATEPVWQEDKLNIPSSMSVNKLYADIFDIRYELRLFFNLEGYKRVRSFSYNGFSIEYRQDGWKEHAFIKQDEYNTDILYEYKTTNGVIDMCHEISIQKRDNIVVDKTVVCSKYRHDNDGAITKIEKYIGPEPNKKTLKSIVEIGYLSDGSIEIKRLFYGTDKEKPFITTVDSYSSRGNLITRSKNNKRDNYYYAESGALVRIDTFDGATITAKEVADNLILIRTERNADEMIVAEKRKLDERKRPVALKITKNQQKTQERVYKIEYRE